MAQHTITAVGQPRQWNGQQGSTFVDYPLRIEGVEKVAILTQKPESPAPQQGQTLELELVPHPRFDDKLKANKPKPAFGGGGRPRSPEERHSIESQACMKAAVEYVIGMAQTGRTEGVSQNTVVEVAKTFFQGLREMQAS